jgi:hypothetical protein
MCLELKKFVGRNVTAKEKRYVLSSGNFTLPTSTKTPASPRSKHRLQSHDSTELEDTRDSEAAGPTVNIVANKGDLIEDKHLK